MFKFVWLNGLHLLILRYIMRSRSILCVLGTLALLLACEKQPGTISVTGVSLDRTNVEFVEGESITLSATVSPDDATNKQVRWSSSNPNILVSNGTITTSFKPGANTTTINGREALGHCTITATTEDGKKKATCKVTVYAKTVDVTGVTLSETTLQLNKGEDHALKATIQPGNASDKTVQWSSSDSSVASVDQDGKVTAVGGGSATIKATAGSFSATCSVSVNVPVTSISLDIHVLSLEKGTFTVLTATVSPEDASDKTVQWSSSDSSVASVDQDGKVTAVEVGKAKITASAGGFSASCSVICVSIPVSAIVLDRTSLSLAKGASETLTASISPREATDKTVTWSSDNPSVATVDQNGQVTAVNAGNACITASAGEVSATCEVTVFIPVTSVSLNSTTLKLLEGETAFLEATVLPEDATDKNVLWYSSHPSVASVDGGTVTAVSFGQTVIVAQIGDQSAMCEVTVLTNSASGVTASFDGGDIRVEDGLILSGSRLDFTITNLTSESITVKSVQLFDGESETGADPIPVGNALESGGTLKWSVEVPEAGVRDPFAVFTFTYHGEDYTCSAKYFEPVVTSRRI